MSEAPIQRGFAAAAVAAAAVAVEAVGAAFHAAQNLTAVGNWPTNGN